VFPHLAEPPESGNRASAHYHEKSVKSTKTSAFFQLNLQLLLLHRFSCASAAVIARNARRTALRAVPAVPATRATRTRDCRAADATRAVASLSGGTLIGVTSCEGHFSRRSRRCARVRRGRDRADERTAEWRPKRSLTLGAVGLTITRSGATSSRRCLPVSRPHQRNAQTLVLNHSLSPRDLVDADLSANRDATGVSNDSP